MRSLARIATQCESRPWDDKSEVHQLSRHDQPDADRVEVEAGPAPSMGLCNPEPVMYAPAAFAERRVDVLHAAIRAMGLATLATFGPDGPEASHIPMMLDPEPAPLGTLIGHVARGNPQARFRGPALAIFVGPDAYITPSWYATKRETGRVVPTWNYIAVHATGTLEPFEDPAELHAVVTRLTDRHEAQRAQPWAVTDAPADYIGGMLRAIVGVRLRIEKLEGAWKNSQNKSGADRRGVAEGLQGSALDPLRASP